MDRSQVAECVVVANAVCVYSYTRVYLHASRMQHA